MSYFCMCLYLALPVFDESYSLLGKSTSLEVSFGDADQEIMAAARTETPVLSNALAKDSVIAQSASFFVVYFPMW